jgi:hypothetical protein
VTSTFTAVAGAVKEKSVVLTAKVATIPLKVVPLFDQFTTMPHTPDVGDAACGDVTL